MRERYETLKLNDLREIAKKRGIKGATGMKKSEIIDLMCELDEKEAAMQRDDLYAAHINDQTLVNLKQCIEYNKRRAVALKQDREIYLFYLQQNEEEQ